MFIRFAMTTAKTTMCHEINGTYGKIANMVIMPSVVRNGMVNQTGGELL